MLTEHFCPSAENASVGHSKWAAETIELWPEKVHSTMQWKDNNVRECVWEVAQSMSISNKLGVSPEQLELLINRCGTRIGDLASTRPLWKWSMTDRTVLEGRQLEAAHDVFAEDDLHWRKNRIDWTPTQQRKFVHVCMYFITQIFLLLCGMYCIYRRWCGGNLGSLVFADRGAFHASTNLLVEPLPYTMAYVDPNVAGKGVGGTNTQLFSQKWPGNDESILSGVTSIVDTMILSTVNAAIAGLPDLCRKIREVCGSQDEANADCSLYARNVTQPSITIRLPDAGRERWNYSTQYVFVGFIVANKPTARLVHSRLYMEAAATFLWMTSSILQQRIWSTILWRNQMMMLRYGAQLQDTAQLPKQDSKCWIGSF